MHGAMLEIVQISLGFRELIQGADIVILSSQCSPKSHIITHTRGDGEDRTSWSITSKDILVKDLNDS